MILRDISKFLYRLIKFFLNPKIVKIYILFFSVLKYLSIGALSYG